MCSDPMEKCRITFVVFSVIRLQGIPAWGKKCMNLYSKKHHTCDEIFSNVLNGITSSQY